MTERPPGGFDQLTSEGLTFRIVGTTRTGYAELLPVWDAATADRKDVVEAIERKVKRYRHLANRLDLPFVVVLSADEGSGMDAAHVDSILAGKNTMTFTIPAYGVGAFDSGPVEIRQTEAAPKLDASLSAVAWLELRDGARAEITRLWPNPGAQRPVQLVDPRLTRNDAVSD